MEKFLNISTLQADLHWEDKVKNLKMFSGLIEKLPATDLIVLPEMFSTGFSMNAKELAEEMNGHTVQWMKTMASESKADITGSVIITDRGQFYNRLLYVKPDGTLFHYDKRHLFSMSDEPKVYQAGAKELIVECKGWKIMLCICYDLRFPASIRNKHKQPYDVLVVVANWPTKRITHWDALLKTRAIENQTYLVAVNRVGVDGSLVEHNGHTSVVHPFGDLLYQSVKEESMTHQLSAHELQLNRRQFPFLKDGDEFEIIP